jgi:hypothetical protein
MQQNPHMRLEMMIVPRARWFDEMVESLPVSLTTYLEAAPE